MNRKRVLLSGISIPFACILLVTGCKNATDIQPVQNQVKVSDPVTTASNMTEPAETAAPAILNEHSATNKPDVKPGDTVKLSSADSDVVPEKKPVENTKEKTQTKPKIDVQESYSQSKPSLMGLTLKASPETVVSKFGKPDEQYTMDDETDPLTVYDYSDFLVGFNKDNQLQFVDVRSSEINPGLNGLKLGQTVNDAYKALGKPDTNTNYVLTYKTEDTVLKLDVDPKTGQINSIKLFPAKS
jgi:hypothetical protein